MFNVNNVLILFVVWLLYLATLSDIVHSKDKDLLDLSNFNLFFI